MSSAITCLSDQCAGDHPYHQGRCHEVRNDKRCECEVPR